MTDTTFDARGMRSRLVSVEGAGAGNRLAEEVLLWLLARATYPGGGLFGTVPDMLRLGSALLTPNGNESQSSGTRLTPNGSGATRPRIVSRATVARMAEQQLDGTTHVAEDGSVSEVRQGIGWRKSAAEWPSGDAVLTHGGRSGSRIWVDPAAGFAYAFVTNLWGASSEAAVAVLEAVYRARP
jgi:CubicO group peptidase (beta-lactamase class C family)